MSSKADKNEIDITDSVDLLPCVVAPNGDPTELCDRNDSALIRAWRDHWNIVQYGTTFRDGKPAIQRWVNDCLPTFEKWSRDVYVMRFYATKDPTNKLYDKLLRWIIQRARTLKRDAKYIIVTTDEQGNEEYQIFKDRKRYVSQPHMFDILHNKHKQTGHGSAGKMYEKIKTDYANVTLKDCQTFVSVCPVCAYKNRRVPRPKGAIKPIVSKNFRDRVQVDLIDMTSYPKRNSQGVECSWILHCKDHFTQFSCLEPIVSKSQEDVLHCLVRIFCRMGFPLIYHTDNGHEVCGQRIMQALRQLAMDCITIQGRIRRPEDQGSAETTNGYTKSIFRMVLLELRMKARADNWPDMLPYIEATLNTTTKISYHNGERCTFTPYEAAFGMPFERSFGDVLPVGSEWCSDRTSIIRECGPGFRKTLIKRNELTSDELLALGEKVTGEEWDLFRSCTDDNEFLDGGGVSYENEPQSSIDRNKLKIIMDLQKEESPDAPFFSEEWLQEMSARFGAEHSSPHVENEATAGAGLKQSPKILRINIDPSASVKAVKESGITATRKEKTQSQQGSQKDSGEVGGESKAAHTKRANSIAGNTPTKTERKRKAPDNDATGRKRNAAAIAGSTLAKTDRKRKATANATDRETNAAANDATDAAVKVVPKKKCRTKTTSKSDKNRVFHDEAPYPVQWGTPPPQDYAFVEKNLTLHFARMLLAASKKSEKRPPHKDYTYESRDRSDTSLAPSKDAGEMGVVFDSVDEGRVNLFTTFPFGFVMPRPSDSTHGPPDPGRPPNVERPSTVSRTIGETVDLTLPPHEETDKDTENGETADLTLPQRGETEATATRTQPLLDAAAPKNKDSGNAKPACTMEQSVIYLRKAPPSKNERSDLDAIRERWTQIKQLNSKEEYEAAVGYVRGFLSEAMAEIKSMEADRTMTVRGNDEAFHSMLSRLRGYMPHHLELLGFAHSIQNNAYKLTVPVAHKEQRSRWIYDTRGAVSSTCDLYIRTESDAVIVERGGAEDTGAAGTGAGCGATGNKCNGAAPKLTGAAEVAAYIVQKKDSMTSLYDTIRKWRAGSAVKMIKARGKDDASHAEVGDYVRFKVSPRTVHTQDRSCVIGVVFRKFDGGGVFVATPSGIVVGGTNNEPYAISANDYQKVFDHAMLTVDLTLLREAIMRGVFDEENHARVSTGQAHADALLYKNLNKNKKKNRSCTCKKTDDDGHCCTAQSRCGCVKNGKTCTKKCQCNGVCSNVE